MSDERRAQVDPRELIRRAARDIPIAAIGYGLGYGISRTAMETLLEKVPALRQPSPMAKRVLPIALGLAAAYATHKTDDAFMKRVRGEE